MSHFSLNILREHQVGWSSFRLTTQNRVVMCYPASKFLVRVREVFLRVRYRETGVRGGRTPADDGIRRRYPRRGQDWRLGGDDWRGWRLEWGSDTCGNLPLHGRC